MCGICGWVQLHSKTDLQCSILERMNALLSHRGPDDKGAVIFDDAALGMCRLSVIDLAGGHQPIANEKENCWIVFNGEIYNFRELRKELKSKGYRFRTRSDTEVVLRAYEEWGADCVRRLRGMFALAIHDRRPGAASNGKNRPPDGPRLFLARDRVGKKPLYYGRANDSLLFASEIKALLAHPSVRPRVNRHIIPLYLTYGYVPAPLTFFDGIYELPPGHTLTVAHGQVAVQQYWEIPGTGDCAPERSEDAYVDRVRGLLEEAVRVRLVSDVPLGAFLSGGLDSTAVVAVAMRLSSEPIKTFAIGFSDDPSFNELEHARSVARTYGTLHHEFVVTPNAIELMPKLVWHYDQPFADSSAIPSYLVAQLTREHVTVALTGDGGDELFAGYERFAAARLAETYRRVPQFLQTAVAQLLGVLPESTTYNGFVRRARRFVQSAALPLTERYLEWVGIFQSGFIREILADGIALDPLGHFRAYFDRGLDEDPISQLLRVNMKSYLPGDLLVKTDRMTMANALEARCPFLDQELLEFASNIPSELKLKGLTTKYILKRALEGLVPEAVIRRRKHGFGVPVGRWFRTCLRDYVRDTLLSPAALRRGYFREETLRRLIEEHQCGKRDHGHRLWALLTFEIWHRIFIDGEIIP
jgi:asparagine synthase (glutamine-hydrolysing)